MTSLAQEFGLRSTLELRNESSSVLVSDSKIGVEVELEDLPPIFRIIEDLNEDRWEVVEDGSLRNNGAEFRFSQPLYGADVVESLERLDEYIKSLGNPQHKLSNRTSVHVHLDVRDLEPFQLFNLLVIYLLVESYLFYLADSQDRMSGYYCVPLSYSPKTIQSLASLMRDSKSIGVRGAFDSIVHSGLKYSALNICPIPNIGSVEFRHHKGEYDSGKLIQWINMILSLKKYVVNKLEDQITVDFIEKSWNTQSKFPSLIQEVLGLEEVDEQFSFSESYQVAKNLISCSSNCQSNSLISYELEKDGMTEDSKFLKRISRSRIMSKDTDTYFKQKMSDIITSIERREGSESNQVGTYVVVDEGMAVSTGTSSPALLPGSPFSRPELRTLREPMREPLVTFSSDTVRRSPEMFSEDSNYYIGGTPVSRLFYLNYIETNESTPALSARGWDIE